MIELKEYKDLVLIGIDHIVELGINPFGFRQRIVYCEDGSVWDYIPEDGLYEKRD